MNIIKEGRNVDILCDCKECGCQFTYKPSEVLIGKILIYNCPEELLRENGGTQDYCGVEHYRYINCPWCGAKIKLNNE